MELDSRDWEEFSSFNQHKEQGSPKNDLTNRHHHQNQSNADDDDKPTLENIYPRNSACFILGVNSDDSDITNVNNDGYNNNNDNNNINTNFTKTLTVEFMNQCFNIINNNDIANDGEAGYVKGQPQNIEGNIGIGDSLIDVYEAVETNKIWKLMAKNFGMTMPVNWSKTRMREYLVGALGMKDKNQTINNNDDNNNNNDSHNNMTTTTTTTLSSSSKTEANGANCQSNNVNHNNDNNSTDITAINGGGDCDGEGDYGDDYGGVAGDDEDEDEEVKKAFDMHTLTLSTHHGEGKSDGGDGEDDGGDKMMFTAEQVISEIEQMMDEEDDDENYPQTSPDDHNNKDETTNNTTTTTIKKPPSQFSSSSSSSSQTLTPFNLKPIKVMKNGGTGGGGGYGEGMPLRRPIIGDLTNMSVLQLCELYDDLDVLCRDYSESLVAELARRDELEYDKEMCNQFITLFLSIQRKKRAHSARKKQNRRSSGKQAHELSTAEKVYLTTTIPYNNTGSPPSSELLATYVKILQAMDSESSNLPRLLTEYILKIVCPTA